MRYSLPVPRSSDRIVLFDESTVTGANVVRCRQDGSVVWRAELPETDTGIDPSDFYTGVGWDIRLPFYARLWAHSYSCYGVRIHPKTGRIESQVFTK